MYRIIYICIYIYLYILGSSLLFGRSLYSACRSVDAKAFDWFSWSPCVTTRTKQRLANADRDEQSTHTHTVGCQYLYVAKKWTTHWEAAYTIPWNAETGRSRERAKLTSWCLNCKPKKWWPTYGYMLPILWYGHKSINSDGKTHNKVNKDLQGFPFFLSWYIQVRPNQCIQWSLHSARALWGDIAKQLRAQAPQQAEFSHEAIIPRYPKPNCHIATCSFEHQG